MDNTFNDLCESRKWLVIGAGKSGIAAAKLLLANGAAVVLYDDNKDVDTEKFPDGMTSVSYTHLAGLENEDFSDFEDCLQMECAKSFEADYIVTRNVDDYSTSEIKAIMPKDYLDL